jgi:hypothetical protein
MNRRVRAELDQLALQRILSPDETQQLAARYPTERWDVLVLVRWFTFLGAVAAGVGVILLAKDSDNATRLGEIGLGVATAGLLTLARWLARAKGLERTGAVLEMAAGFTLQGLTVILALDFSTGSKNWPALIGLNTALLTLLAYLLRNRLVLLHAGVCFFVYFGGETGYVTDWDSRWLGMTYPVRFLVVGLSFLGIAWLHAVRLRGAYQSFSRVYAHLGLLVVNGAFWLLALFGRDDLFRWTADPPERIGWSAAWAAACLACIWLGGKWGQRALRAYGFTFFVLDAYTFYFQFVVERSTEAWWLHLLLVGGSLVGLGVWLERRLRSR